VRAQAKSVTVPRVSIADISDSQQSYETEMDLTLFPGYVIALKVPLYEHDGPGSVELTSVEPQPTEADMNDREGFSVDSFLEARRVHDVDEVFRVMYVHMDGGARVQEGRVEEGELIWPVGSSFMPPGLLNDQVFSIVDDSTIVID
jgi:hypothetical protein